MSDRSYNFKFTISGRESVRESKFFPPIELSEDKNYVLGLVDLYTYYSIPNIYTGCNKFYVGNQQYTIPDGSYEIDSLEEYLMEILLDHKVTLSLKANKSTLRCEITCNQDIDFEKEDSIHKLLGFAKKKLIANEKHLSDQPIKILKINSLGIICNIIDGAYVNGQKAYIIHKFFPSVRPGFKIIEIPREIIYLPVRTKVIDNIKLSIIDQDGNLVDFRGETITIRLHLKSL